MARISQEAFDSAVRENVEEFGMDEGEALADAIHTFKLQGVDLTGIITDGKSPLQHPVLQAIHQLGSVEDDDSLLAEALDSLRLACSDENVAIAVKNGAVERSFSACKRFIGSKNCPALCTALDTLCTLLAEKQAKVDFAKCNGPEVIANALSLDDDAGAVSRLLGTVIARAATGSEILKDRFMDLKTAEALLDVIKRFGKNAEVLCRACDALKALVTADDDSVPASNAFKNARTIAKLGGVEVVLEASRSSLGDSSLLAALCGTLKALAVNEEVCQSVATLGGLELVLQFMRDSLKTSNKAVAKNSCSLLGQLAGSDSNKNEIVSLQGLPTLVQLASCFAEDVQVLQEVMYALASLTLRSPSNASKAVDAGAVDLAVEMMEKHPQAAGMQRQACQMLRNLAVRNPENRPQMLEKGLDTLIRRAKSRHPSCKDAASAALRDLGLDDYT